MAAENKTILTNAKLHQHLTRLVFAVAVIVTALALSSAPVNAETQAKPFSFGGPGSGTNQTTITLSIPARTKVKVSGVLNPTTGLPVPVVIEIMKPGSSFPAASLGWTTAPVSVPFIFGVEAVSILHESAHPACRQLARALWYWSDFAGPR